MFFFVLAFAHVHVSFISAGLRVCVCASPVPVITPHIISIRAEVLDDTAGV